ncbi:Uncharacterised protein [Mycobacterium tuberculosis]|nr:Uncharacterised protein [Mycobacterium tuberculosis]
MSKSQRPTKPHDPVELARELQRQRDLEAARRTDELERVRAEAGHGRARADVAEESRLAEMARAEREADARAEAELARMFREFRAAGTRTQIKSDMARSGEARALRLEWLRTHNLRVLVPVMIGFGLWSTTGVQQGAARIMHVTSHHPVWWALWGLEALLIGAVCWIIISRARLDSSGGTLAVQAERIGVGCLTTSIVLNLVAAMPFGPGPHPSGWEVLGAMFAHALGPVGAAVSAHLIGVIDRSISLADPWHDKDGKAVPRLAGMDLQRPVAARAETAPQDRPHENPATRTDARMEESARESAPARTEERAEERAERLREPASASARRPALRSVSSSARGQERPRTTVRTDGRTASRTDGDPVDRDAIVAELAAEILTAGEAGAKWGPDYPALMARTGRKRRWCEAVVSDARTAVLRSSADDAADDGADADGDPHETPHGAPHEGPHEGPQEGPQEGPHGRSADADGEGPHGPRADGPQDERAEGRAEPARSSGELALTGTDGGGR